MARRMTKKETTTISLIAFLIIFGVILTAIGKFFKTVGFIVPVIVGVIAIGFYWLYNSNKKKGKLTYLRNKYKDEEIVQKIFAGYFWQGQTSDQLIDSLGKPMDIDEVVLKTKKKKIWKYQHQGGNRYGLRITLEDNTVVGWEQKE